MDTVKVSTEVNVGNHFTLAVLAEIDKNLNNRDYHITDLCNNLHMSRTRLYRKLKEFTGLTFSEIVQKRRILKATGLLTNTNLNILQISLELGFSDPSYFVKVFRKEMEMTPSTFKKIKDIQRLGLC